MDRSKLPKRDKREKSIWEKFFGGGETVKSKGRGRQVGATSYIRRKQQATKALDDAGRMPRRK